MFKQRPSFNMTREKMQISGKKAKGKRLEEKAEAGIIRSNIIDATHEDTYIDFR